MNIYIRKYIGELTIRDITQEREELSKNGILNFIKFLNYELAPEEVFLTNSIPIKIWDELIEI